VAFVAENVKGLASRKVFHQRLTEDFDGLEGYKVSQKIFMAADYGVPQKRERLFIVGMRGEKPFEPPAPSSPEWITAGEALRDLESMEENPENSHSWSRAAASPDQGSRKLRKDAPATTIRAEHHGNTQWHYSLERRISLREAARLQSFPDDFVFPSGMRETERQIGNAVPPVLAWHIASALRDQIT